MKSATLLARFISLIFHPLLIPTWGFLLLFNSGFYFSLVTWPVQRFVLLVVFLSTCLLPLLTIGILSINPRFNRNMEKSSDRIIPLLLSSVYYYIGYYMLGRVPVYPAYKLFLISSILIIVLLLIISIKWKISNHMAAIGGIVGGFLGLTFRLDVNTTGTIILLILISGFLGTSRLMLEKHTPSQIYAGYFLGLSTMYLIMTFI
jgi:hypothetical protein